MDLRRFRPAIVDADLHQDVFGGFLGVFHEHVEVTVLAEHARIEQLVFELVASAPAVGRHEIAVGIGRLRILVEILQVGMGRRAVEVKIVFLHVLAVIALAVRQAEEPLLEDRVATIPERERETEPLPVIADARQSVLAPVICPRA